MSKRKLDVQQQIFAFPDEQLKISLHDEIVLWLKRNAQDIGARLTRWTRTWDPHLIESCRKRAAATVESRVDLLQEAITKENARLEAIRRGQCRFYVAEDVEKRVQAMEAELNFLRSWNGLGDTPEPKLNVCCEIERPILCRRREIDIVGFIDIVLFVRALRLRAGIPPTDDYGSPNLGVDARNYAEWEPYWSGVLSFAFDAKKHIRSLGELLRQFKTYRACSRLPFYVVSPDARFANEISDEGFGFIKYPEAVITFPKSSIHR
jgi:hypothetical protein